MPYVQRNNDGAIKGVYSVMQPGYAEEWVLDNDPAVISFRSQTSPTHTLTARQLRLGLVTNGFTLEQVEAAIAAIEDPQQRTVAQIEWEYASQFKRDHALLGKVGAALGLTDEQIDAMWQQALIL